MIPSTSPYSRLNEHTLDIIINTIYTVQEGMSGPGDHPSDYAPSTVRTGKDFDRNIVAAICSSATFRSDHQTLHVIYTVNITTFYIHSSVVFVQQTPACRRRP